MCMAAEAQASGAQTDHYPSVSARVMADALRTVIETDHIIYTHQVVNRLQHQEGVIQANEHWYDEQALPLPSQLLSMAADEVAKKDIGISYGMKSDWPINSLNKFTSGVEQQGFDFLQSTSNKNFYLTHSIEGRAYFTAVYPVIADSASCVSCHNEHQDSPRKDFKLGDLMGGLVIKIRLAQPSTLIKEALQKSG